MSPLSTPLSLKKKINYASPRKRQGPGLSRPHAMLRDLRRSVSARFTTTSTHNLFGLRLFVRRLHAAFGWRYLAILVSEYGINQGTGLRLAGSAKSYYLLDEVGMTSADYGHLSGFTHIPWQLKSIFGLLSDTVAVRGLHRTPYLLLAGSVGLLSNSFPTPRSARPFSADGM